MLNRRESRLGFVGGLARSLRVWAILLLTIVQVVATTTVSSASAHREASFESLSQLATPTNSPPDEWSGQFTWGDWFGGRRQLVTLRCLAGSNCRLTGLNGISEINFSEGVDGSAMIKSPTFAVSALIPANGGYFEADPGWKTPCNPWPECHKKIDQLWMPTSLGNVPLDASRATGAGEWKLGGLLQLASRNVRVTLELNYPESFILRVVWNTYWENRDCLDSTERCAVLPLGGGLIKSQSATTTVRATTTTTVRPTTTTVRATTTTTVRPTTTAVRATTTTTVRPTTTTARATTTTVRPTTTTARATTTTARPIVLVSSVRIRIVPDSCQLSVSWSDLVDGGYIKVERRLLRETQDFPKFPSDSDSRYWLSDVRTSYRSPLNVSVRDIPECHIRQAIKVLVCNAVGSCSEVLTERVALDPDDRSKSYVLNRIVNNALLDTWRRLKSDTDYLAWADRGTDACSKSPDKTKYFEFFEACTYHDFLYRNAKRLEVFTEFNARNYDKSFKFMMTSWCESKFDKEDDLDACYVAANFYYAGVVAARRWDDKKVLQPGRIVSQKFELLSREPSGLRVNQVFAVRLTLECSEPMEEWNFPLLNAVNLRAADGRSWLYPTGSPTIKRSKKGFWGGLVKVSYSIRLSSPLPGNLQLTPVLELDSGPCFGAKGPNGQVSQPSLQSLEVQVTSTEGQDCRANNSHKKLVAVWREGTSVRWFIRNNANDRRLGIVKWQIVPLRDYEASDTSSPFWRFGTDCDPREYFNIQYRPSEVASESIANRSFIGGKLNLSGGTVGLGLHGVNKSGATVAFEWGFFAKRAGGNFWGDIGAQFFEFACKSAAFGSAGNRTVLVTSKATLEAIGVGLAVVDFASSFGIKTNGLERESLILELGTLGLDLFLIEQGLDSTGKPVAKAGWNNLSKEEREQKRKQMNDILITYGASKAVEWTENASGAPGASLAFTIGMSMDTFDRIFSGQVGTSIGDDLSESWSLCGVYE